MYKQAKDMNGVVLNNTVVRVADNAFIPFDPANTDFQEYQKWIALGNQPLLADEPTL